MPADRIIEVHLGTGSRNEFGEWTPGNVVIHRVWCTKTDVDLERVIDSGGSRREIQRTWRIRWNDAIYTHSIALIDVVDGALRFRVQNVQEVTRQRGRRAELRRRFIDLTGTNTT